nr:MAG TPA: hypothetical protein [Caudoviricetes sp.]
MGSEIFCSFAWLFPANPHCFIKRKNVIPMLLVY